MKRILTGMIGTALLVALAAPVVAVDEEYSVSPVTSTTLAGGTNNIVKASTNTYTTAIINGTQHEKIALALSFKMSSATNTADVITFKLYPGYDSTTFATTGPGVLTINVTANGTSTACLVTNLDFGRFGYYKIATGANTNADDYATNVYAGVVTKPILEGYKK